MATVLTTTTPADSVQIIAPRHILKGERYSTAVITSMRTAIEGTLKLCLGHGPSTAGKTATPVVPARWFLRKVLTNATLARNYAAFQQSDVMRNSSKSMLINKVDHYAAGALSFLWDGAAGNATIAVEDELVFWGVGTIPTGAGDVISYGAGLGAESMRLDVLGTSGSVAFQVDTASKYTHENNEIVSLGNCWDITLDRGCDYILTIDHMMETADVGAIIAFADLTKVDSLTST
jgi:hypothetical protein